MVTYRCSVHNINTNTSTCFACNSREHVQMQSEIFWCKGCNVPIYEKVCPICKQEGITAAKDVRPVFMEERLLLEILLGKPFCFVKSSVFRTSGNYYLIDGNKVNLALKDMMSLDVTRIKEEYDALNKKNTDQYGQQYRQQFVSCNIKRMSQIEEEALSYLKKVSENVSNQDLFVSFSGGKDSTVTSDLVMRALGNPKILHIFGDTTLEFVTTAEYVARFKKEHPYTPVVSSRNKEKDFYQLCKQIGPPSRVMRWCCTIFKTGAIHRKIDALFKGKDKILAFYGIRRSESTSRSKYERESKGHKIARQITISPVIDWLDFDIWLYILSRDLDFNSAYRLGYSRVGCWCCPNNGIWSEFLSRIHMAKQYGEFRNFLVEFARSIGKPDAEEYVDTGKWKARQGGNGIAYADKAVVSFEPCAVEENTFQYELQEVIEEDLYEFMRPFGRVDKTMGNERLGEVYVQKANGQPVLRLKGKIGTDLLRVTIFDERIGKAKSITAAEERIKCQLTKYQMCMGCRACEGICPKGAIKIESKGQGRPVYHISEEKCTGCMKCVNHFLGGCYMRKVLAVRSRERG